MHSGSEPVFQRGVRAVHVQFAVLKHREAELKGLVDHLIDFTTFDWNEVGVEQSEVDALRFLCDSASLLNVREDFDICPLGDILDRFTLGCVVHHLEERPLALVLTGGRALVRIKFDVVGERRSRLEPDPSIEFRHLHLALDVKIESR